MRRPTRIALWASTLALSACAPREPVRLRWAEHSTPLVQAVKPTLSVTSIEAAPSSPAKARDFSERTAAAYIAALADKIPDPDAFRSAVAAGIAPGKIGDTDQTRLSRTMVIAVGKQGYQAGHRLVVADVVIVPIGFAFGDFTLAASKYETIDLENVSVQSTTTAKIDVAPKFGSVEATDASLTQEEKAGTSYTNRARIEALTPDFRPDRIEIYQQSGPNEDLTGTVLISASVRPVALEPTAQRQQLTALGLPDAEPFRFRVDQAEPQVIVAKVALADEKGHALAPDAASITTAVDQIWRARPLYVCAAMSYVERVPHNGTARFFDEGRQVVTEQTGTVEGQVFQLVPAEEVSRPLWSITDAQGGGVMIDVDGKPAPFSFTDFLQASRFAAWVNAGHATKVGTRLLWTSANGAPSRLAIAAGRELAVTRTFGAGPAPVVGKQNCTVPSR